MKEHPIIFSTEMIKAILEGRKTQTRRMIKPQPDDIFDGLPYQYLGYDYFDASHKRIKYLYGQVGDRLWVRETWAAQPFYDDYPPRDIPTDSVVFYRTNDRLKLEVAKEHRDLGKWRPSIFMPRWASRIILEIIEVRVERLQEISTKDKEFIAEGIPLICYPNNRTDWTEMAYQFSLLWDSLNAKRGYSWESNPWVWIISFKEVKQ